MITLKKGSARVSLAERGAELKSFVFDGTEYIWQGHADVWPASCPLMFPVCGGLKNDKYTLEGKEYSLGKHGYGRFKTFAVEAADEASATFLLTEDEESLAQFPFRYELRVSYRLEEQGSLHITYSVKNNSGKTMYFSIGSHEGYATPEGIEDYDVIFEKPENLQARLTVGNILGDQYVPLLKNGTVLPMYDKFFTVDALVFQHLNSRSVTLKNRRTGRGVRVDFPETEHLVLWHKHSAGFLCIEPWNGYHDTPACSGDLAEKEGITALAAGETYTRTHTISILA